MIKAIRKYQIGEPTYVYLILEKILMMPKFFYCEELIFLTNLAIDEILSIFENKNWFYFYCRCL